MTIQTPEFQQFLAGYMAALLWSSTDEVDGETVELDDFATSTQADDHCRAACLAFFEGNRESLEQYARHREGRTDGTATVWEHAGHDFALTRNHHGAGYWDRGLPQDLADHLTDAAQDVGECWPYVGDDELVYIQ